MCAPMTAEAVVAHLGIVLAGCVVVGIAESFSVAEVTARLRISGAAAIVTQVCQRAHTHSTSLYIVCNFA